MKRTKKNFKKRFIYVQKKASDEMGESQQNALLYLDAGTHSTDEVHTATVTAIATGYRPHTEHMLQTTHREQATDHIQHTCYRPHTEHTTASEL